MTYRTDDGETFTATSAPDTVEPTDEHRFLERFLDGPSYRLAIDPAASPERLTMTAPNGERLVLDAVL